MTTFDREYRELDRLKGVSLKDNVLLYKITPCQVCYRVGCQGSCMANAYSPAIEAHREQAIPQVEPQAKKPWKLRLAIFLGVLSWFWYELVKYLGWFS